MYRSYRNRDNVLPRDNDWSRSIHSNEDPKMVVPVEKMYTYVSAASYSREDPIRRAGRSSDFLAPDLHRLLTWKNETFFPQWHERMRVFRFCLSKRSWATPFGGECIFHNLSVFSKRFFRKQCAKLQRRGPFRLMMWFHEIRHPTSNRRGLFMTGV